MIRGDEVPVRGLTLDALDRDYLRKFCDRHYGESNREMPLENLMENMGLTTDGVLTVGGGLLFCNNVEFRLPTFIVRGMAFHGRTVDVANYDDSQDATGRMENVFRESVAFVKRNLRHVQEDQHVNSLGQPEVPKIVIEELLANALLHRDYFVSAPIVVFVFVDRIEDQEPGTPAQQPYDRAHEDGHVRRPQLNPDFLRHEDTAVPRHRQWRPPSAGGVPGHRLRQRRRRQPVRCDGVANGAVRVE